MQKASNKPFDFGLVLAQLKHEVQHIPANAQNGDLVRTAVVFLMSIEEVITDLRARVKALEAQNATLRGAGVPPATPR